MSRFLLIAFFLSACASGRLHFVNSPGKKNTVLHEVQKDDNLSLRDEGYELNEVPADSIFSDETASKNNPPAKEELRAKRNDRFIKSVEENFAQDIPALKPHLERLKELRHSASVDPDEKDDDQKQTTGTILLIIGLILALISVYFFYRSENVTTDSSTVDGCAVALMESFIYVIWGMIFGIAGVILIVIGLIFKAAASSGISGKE